MIYVDVGGRLGNQLFYYAIARKIQLITGEKQEICLTFHSLIAGRPEVGNGYENSLKWFNVEPHRVADDAMSEIIKSRAVGGGKIAWYCGELAKRIAYKGMDHYIVSITLEKLSNHLERYGLIYYPHRLNEAKRKVSLDNLNLRKKDYFIQGTFENPAWFYDIRDVLKHDIVPINAPLNDNDVLYNVIDKSNSVCVSIRRGDFLSPNNRGCFYVCTEKYFKNAIEYIKGKLNNAVFIAFSDDIEWVKNSGIFSHDDIVYYESGHDPVWEKLRLMYSCKHFIISNSTFSWWAQFLSRNEEKIVVAPDHWFNLNCTWPLLMDEFVKIKTI